MTGTCTFAALSFFRGQIDLGLERCRHLLDSYCAADDPVGYFIAAVRVRDLLAECRAENPSVFTAVFGIVGAVQAHLDEFRDRRRSRAGRLLISQLFAPVIDRFFMDFSEPGLPEDWRRKGPTTETLFDVFRDRSVLTLGVRPVQAAAGSTQHTVHALSFRRGRIGGGGGRAPPVGAPGLGRSRIVRGTIGDPALARIPGKTREQTQPRGQRIRTASGRSMHSRQPWPRLRPGSKGMATSRTCNGCGPSCVPAKRC